jgi:anti-sigma factor ChrR (cupin superfamily)
VFIVEKLDRMEHHFVRVTTSQYYHDMAPAADDSGMALVNTVESNKSRYTERAYSQATLACKLQKMIGYPST